MEAQSALTFWIGRLKAGDPEAARPIWDACYRRVVQQARRKLGGRSHGAAGSEDVAQSAFKSFFRGVEGRHFPDLGNRNDLWQLLMMLVERKAIDLARRETSHKRGGGKVKPLPPDGSIRDPKPPPGLAVEIAEQIERLGDAKLRGVAIGIMMGYTHAEIAGQLGCTVSTVERKVALIRDLWGKELADEQRRRGADPRPGGRPRGGRPV